MAEDHDPEDARPQACPACGAADAEVVEDVSDEVTVYGCPRCATTWAQRRRPDW